ncbi:ficolin-1-like [Physella acuta]|uniref:ficolin-1-like n=1 Tax=Physella acuta TaxID=109671 RepID=UPI0027DB924A|nr:ficolin-1-like [Physella acuta]
MSLLFYITVFAVVLRVNGEGIRETKNSTDMGSVIIKDGREEDTSFLQLRDIKSQARKLVIKKLVQSCPTPETCRDVVSSQPRPVVILSSGLEVMCDTQTDGGGWTVIQRRFNGQTNFYRGWEEYKYGFGDFDVGEFWLGNDNIHRLTSLRRYELRVDFKFNNTDYFAQYSSFRVYGEQERYRLKVSGYLGTAGDSLTDKHNNLTFSTFDKDNDLYYGNCAQIFHGAWWYCACHHVNLNGLWGSTEFGKGVIWKLKTNLYASATFTEMKIRPIE